jgi:hypothetical protein
MRITVAVHGHLRDTSSIGQDELTMTLPDANALRIRDLLEPLNIVEEEVGEIIYNGRRVRLDTNIRHRAKVAFFPRHARVPRAHQPTA